MGLMKLLFGVVLGVALGASAHAQSWRGQVSASANPTPDSYLSVADLRSRYGDAQSRYMTIKGVEIHYKDEGAGQVLLMVHGSQSTLRTWDAIVGRMKARYRIIRFDVPGYGLSGSVSDEAAAHVKPVEIAEGLIDALRIEKLTAIGVSSGGTMSMYLAAKRPEIVERLVLSNTPSDPVKTDHLVMPDSFLAAQARYKRTGVYDRIFWEEFLSYFYGRKSRLTNSTLDEYTDFNRRTPERHPIALVARIGDGVQARVEMAKIRAPTLLIWGGADQLLPESAADSLAAYLPSAQLSRMMMPDVGHYPPLEAPDRFATLLAAYIEDIVPDEALSR